MMVVVSDAVLVECRRSAGLDTADKSLFGEDSDRVINRLSRNRPDLGADFLSEGVRRDVGTARHCPQHGQTLGGHEDALIAEKFSPIGHGLVIRP